MNTSPNSGVHTGLAPVSKVVFTHCSRAVYTQFSASHAVSKRFELSVSEGLVRCNRNRVPSQCANLGYFMIW